MWRSLVAHLTGGQGVAGSNPVIPTNFTKTRRPKESGPRPKGWIQERGLRSILLQLTLILRRFVHVLALRFIHRGAVCAIVFTGAAVSAQHPTPVARMSFFVTSAGPGSGGNLGGLKGADAHCQKLASSVGAGDRQWRASLSARDMGRNAGRRTGSHRQRTLAQLKTPPSGRKPRRIAQREEQNCFLQCAEREGRDCRPVSVTTSSLGRSPTARWRLTRRTRPAMIGRVTASGRAMVGHHDKVGGPNSWNSAHLTQGCDVVSLRSSQGAGLLYCFAAK